MVKEKNKKNGGFWTPRTVLVMLLFFFELGVLLKAMSTGHDNKDHIRRLQRPKRSNKDPSPIINATVHSCDGNNAYRFGVQACIPRNTSVIISVPYSALIHGMPDGDRGTNYGNSFSWYMTNDQQDRRWETLVADEWSRWTPRWAQTEWAKYQSQSLKMYQTDDKLFIVVNTTEKGTIFPPDIEGDCWLFLLWVYKQGKDPYFHFFLCETDRVQQPILTELSTSKGVSIQAKGVPIQAKGVSVQGTKDMKADDWFLVTTGISGQNNNWLLMAEQAGLAAKEDCVVCMGPRPVLQVIPAALPKDCLLTAMTQTYIAVNNKCFKWDKIYPVTKLTKIKPLFSSKVGHANHTCVHLTGTSKTLGSLNHTAWCKNVVHSTPTFKPVGRSDVWWWCGDNRIFDRLPRNVSGYCALISLLLPVEAIPMTPEDVTTYAASLIPEDWQKGIARHRVKRDWKGVGNPTYIDAIGVPRGVPDEYKLVDQIAAGFESSICWWCSINKNVDRINYIHYNVQKLGNWTEEGFKAVHSQLEATSLMAFQNRIALDMLLAEKGGVCAMFGEQCCTFIPNNTAADGSLTQAIDGLRTLNRKMKEHSGVNTEGWDWWLEGMGKWRSLISSLLVSIAVFAAILTLCGCCCIPCLRGLVNRMITTAISPGPGGGPASYPLLGTDDDKEDDGSPDLYPDQWKYDDPDTDDGDNDDITSGV